MVDQLPAFLGIAVLLIVTPGPDMALVMRNALLGGRRTGIFAALLLLGLLFCSLGLIWLIAYAAAAAKAGDALRSPRVRRAIEGCTGAVLVGLGVRLATARR